MSNDLLHAVNRTLKCYINQCTLLYVIFLLILFKFSEITLNSKNYCLFLRQRKLFWEMKIS